MLSVKQLETNFVIKVYKEHLLQDFVPAEQKPLDIMIDLINRGLYICYGLFDEEKFVAYAFFMKVEAYKDILIDYFAVCKQYRNCGYGSKFLDLLKKELTEYNSVIFEVESGEDAKDQEELEICNKRLAFYHRNGLQHTKLKVSLFGNDMVILYLKLQEAPSDHQLYEALDVIYDTMFGKELHSKRVIVQKLI